MYLHTYNCRSVTSSVYGSAALKKAAVCNFKLDSVIPDWNSPSITQQFAKKTPPFAIKRLSDLQEGDLILETPSVHFSFKIAPNPFAEGSDCLVYHGSDLVNFRKIVLKKFKRSGREHNTLDCYMRELLVRAISTTYTREFNIEKLKPPNTCTLNYTPLDVVQCNEGTFYLMESFLKGKFEKFNNNHGVVVRRSPYSDLLQAFSHYTWVKSARSLLICDLQGTKESANDCIILTDPAIHSTGTPGRYGPMDAGMEGVRAFFRTHSCSTICSQMKLIGQCI